jgi:PleD family two-component response regulator
LQWGQALLESLRSGKPAQVEWHRDDAIAHESWVRVVVNPFAQGVVITMSDITKLKSKERALEQLNRHLGQLANSDALTGASNRRHFFTAAEAEIARTRRHTLPPFIIAIDVDEFKQLNDRLGHAAGDAALKALVQMCHRSLRAHDTLGRIGGDEFAILLPHTDENEACDLAQ